MGLLATVNHRNVGREGSIEKRLIISSQVRILSLLPILHSSRPHPLMGGEGNMKPFKPVDKSKIEVIVRYGTKPTIQTSDRANRVSS